MLFTLHGLNVEMQPTITKWGFDDLGDDPAKHRWRATWALSGVDDVGGIRLNAYPVVKTNPASVWIDELAYRQATKQPWEEGAPAYEWMAYGGKPVRTRLLHNGSGQAWAKPTQEEAIRSLAIRLCRWTANLRRDVGYAERAIKALEALRPEWPAYAEHAKQNLAGNTAGTLSGDR